MKKKLLCFLIVVIGIILNTRTIYAGWGDYDVNWSPEGNKLVFSGFGVMYTAENNKPYEGYLRYIDYIEVGEDVYNVGTEAFQNSTVKEFITTNQSISMYDNCFEDCNNLKRITAPNLEQIYLYSYVFKNCTQLEDVSAIENCIYAEIGVGAFYGCSSLEELSLMNTEQEGIYRETFYDCSNLTTIKIPASIKKIYKDAFYGCNNIRDIYYAGTREQWDTVTIETGNEAINMANIHCIDDKEDTKKLCLVTVYDDSQIQLIWDQKIGYDKRKFELPFSVISLPAENNETIKYENLDVRFELQSDLFSLSEIDQINVVEKVIPQIDSEKNKYINMSIPIWTQSAEWIDSIDFLITVSLGEVELTSCAGKIHPINKDLVGNNKILSRLPENGADQVDPQKYSNSDDITLYFDENLKVGDGYIQIINKESKKVQYCNVLTDVQIEKNIMRIKNVKLDYGKTYSIVFDRGCIYVGGKKFLGLSEESDWVFSTKDRLRYVEDTWNFSNPTSKISFDVYKKFFDSAVARRLKSNDDGTGGHCAGMVLSSMATYLGYPSTTSYGEKSNLNSIGKNDKSSETGCTAGKYIDYAHVYQYTSEFSESKELHNNDYEGLYNAIRRFEENGAEPVYISIGNSTGGHALMALKIEKEAQTETKIRVYDCNHPNEKCYLNLMGTIGHYTGWNYNLGEGIVWNSTQENARLRFTVMARSFINDYKKITDKNKGNMLLSISKSADGLLNYYDKMLLIDNLLPVGSKDIVPISGDNRIVCNYNSYWISNPENTISIDTLKTDTEVLLAKNDLEISAKLKLCGNIVLNMNEKSVHLMNENESEFEIGYRKTEMDGSSEFVTIKGVSDGNASSKEENGDLILSGIKKCSIIKSKIGVNEDSQEENVCQITVSDMHEKNKYKVAVSSVNGIEIYEDINGDGKYDRTVLSEKNNIIKLNSKIIVGKGLYKIASVDNINPTVEYMGTTASGKKKKTVSIPEYVSYNGVKYRVTSVAAKCFKNNKKLTNIKIASSITKIGNSAFEGCSNLKTVTVGKGLKAIGKNVFKNCKSLKKITLKSTKLKTVGKTTLKGVNAKCRIKVPAKKVKAYQKLFKGKGQKASVKVIK